MKDRTFDLSFRPDYWLPEKAIIANIKGAWRQGQVIEAIKNGTVEEIPSAIFAESLDEKVREFTGSIHPMLMGGEYLPDFVPGEVEIARIELDSTLGDVISIRARPIRGARIEYRVVDEYGDDPDWPAYIWSPRTSRQPLTLGRMIRFIDRIRTTACLEFRSSFVRYLWETCVGHVDLEEAAAFASVHSEFYPQLTGWYREMSRRWLNWKSGRRAPRRARRIAKRLPLFEGIIEP